MNPPLLDIFFGFLLSFCIVIPSAVLVFYILKTPYIANKIEECQRHEVEVIIEQLEEQSNLLSKIN